MPRVCCTDVKMTFPFAVINSIAVIIPAQNFLGRTSVIGNWQRELAEDFQKSFNLQNGNVLSNKFSSCFLFCPGNGKTQTNSFLGALQIQWRLVSILAKNVFIH